LVRVLIADKYYPFRRLFRSILEEKPGLEVVEEASDGLAIIQKIEELQPDVVLLDIGLPASNVVETVKQIRIISPKSKIVIMGQQSSPEFIAEALSTGADHYLVKWKAARDLTAMVLALVSHK
jgi:DNA-binding NarL/FixJ family response regulator